MKTHKNDPGTTRVNDQGKGQRKLNHRSLFPSFWLMLLAVVVTISLILFSGIKVVNLGHERNQLQLKRVTLDEQAKTLESDIASHAKFLKELPELKSRHMDLGTKITGLEGILRDLINRESTLAQKVTSLQHDLEAAVADRNQAEAATKAARNETARLGSEISGLKTEELALGLNVAKLRQDADRLKPQVEDLTSQAQSLDTEIVNLMKTKEARLSDLEALANDNSRLVNLGLHLKGLVVDMKGSREKAEDAADILQRAAAKAQQAAVDLANSSQASSGAINGLNTSGANLTRLVENLDTKRNEVNSAVADLVSAGSTAKAQVQSLTARLDGPINSLDSSTAALGSHVQNLGPMVDDISGSQNRLSDTTTQFGTLGTQFESVKTRLTAEAQDLENQVGLLERATTDINAGGQTLQVAIRKFETRQQGIEKTAAVTLDTQVRAAEQALQKFTALIVRLSPNTSGDRGTGHSLENMVAELKATLTAAASTLEDVRRLREVASAAFLSNGNKLKNVLENMVSDAEALQKEIRAQLETVIKQTSQPQDPATDTGSASRRQKEKH